MRKTVISFALCALLPALYASAEAQQPKKVPRIGFLCAQSASRSADRVEAFRQGLRELGYSVGKNILIEYRWADGITDRLPDLAADLVNLRVDVIVASGGTPATIAAKNATNTIPVVFTGGGDVVATGLAASFARPGGNLTGVTIGGPELWGKRLELLKETIPKLSRVAYIRNPNSPAQQQQLKEMRATAEALGVQLQILEVLTPNEIAGAFDTAVKARADGLIVSQVPPISTDLKRIVLLAEKSRLPAIYADGTWPEVGGLMSYGPSITENHRRLATYVDKILKGSKPGDIPVEQPMKFELIINLKAAKQIGLTIPPNVLVRADKVIK